MNEIVGAVLEVDGKKHRVLACTVKGDSSGSGYIAAVGGYVLLLAAIDDGQIWQYALPSLVVIGGLPMRIVGHELRVGDVAALRAQGYRAASEHARLEREDVDRKLAEVRAERDQLQDTIKNLEGRLAAAQHVERKVPRLHTPFESDPSKETVKALEDLGKPGEATRHGG